MDSHTISEELSQREQEFDETRICLTFGEHALQFQSVHLERYETMGESQTGEQILKCHPKSSRRVRLHTVSKGDCYHSARMHLLAALDAVKHNDL